MLGCSVGTNKESSSGKTIPQKIAISHDVFILVIGRYISNTLFPYSRNFVIGIYGFEVSSFFIVTGPIRPEGISPEVGEKPIFVLVILSFSGNEAS